VSVIISVEGSNSNMSFEKDIDLLEQQLNELKRIAEIYKS